MEIITKPSKRSDQEFYQHLFNENYDKNYIDINKNFKKCSLLEDVNITYTTDSTKNKIINKNYLI